MGCIALQYVKGVRLGRRHTTKKVMGVFVEARVAATGSDSVASRKKFSGRFLKLLQTENGRQQIEHVTQLTGIAKVLGDRHGTKRSEYELARDEYRMSVLIEIESKIDDVGYALAVGSPSWESFYEFGRLEAALLMQYGLTDCARLVDVGCGSGRLALSLPDAFKGDYLGTDISEPLLKYLAQSRNSPRFQFVHVDGLSIPVEDESVDMVSMFSLLTHLRHEESFMYLRDARRTLRKGGTVVFSFLDFSQANHHHEFLKTVAAVEAGLLHHVNQFMSRDLITAWAQMLEFEVVAIHDGESNHIRLDESDGSVRFGSLGQSVAVWRRP